MLVGINYVGTSSELNGCFNDMLDMRNLLVTSGVNPKNITTLSDDPTRNDIKPTKANILDQLVKKGRAAKAGDTLVIHYSGHGTYSRDYGSDEPDKRDEAICPINGRKIENISDDELYSVLRRLPKDVKAFVVMDCCHSGSDLDLGEGIDKAPSKRRPDNTHGFVFQISGCQDDQTSADALFEEERAKDKVKVEDEAKDKAIEKVNKREIIQRIHKRGLKEPVERYRGALTEAILYTANKRRGLHSILDVAFSGNVSSIKSLRTDIRSRLKENNFEQLAEISFEGAKPATLSSRGESVVHGYRVASHNLRQTKARIAEVGKKAGTYVPTEDLQHHAVKLR